VKNAVIVPVGAKGGFFPKLLPRVSQRDAWLAEGAESYKLFVGETHVTWVGVVEDGPPGVVFSSDGGDVVGVEGFEHRW
jgi:glutamate dehydrogenase